MGLVLCSNFLGLLPYVFTPSRHLRYSVSLSLPIWLGYILYSLIIQFEENIAHLVPEGTPGALLRVIVLIESVRLIIRPWTLAIRLAANIVAGHLLLTLLGGQGVNCGGGNFNMLNRGSHCFIRFRNWSSLYSSLCFCCS